jgi:hypothetical protein
VSSKRETPDLKAWLREAADVIESHPLPGESRGSFERFVLDHGEPFASRKLTVAEHAWARGILGSTWPRDRLWASFTLAVPCLTVSFEGVRKLPLGPGAGHLVSLMDGQSTVEVVLDACVLERDEALAMIARLFQLEAIELRDP